MALSIFSPLRISLSLRSSLFLIIIFFKKTSCSKKPSLVLVFPRSIAKYLFIFQNYKKGLKKLLLLFRELRILFLNLPTTKKNGAIAQSVEQRTENPCVAGSIPAGTTFYKLN